MLGIYHNQSLIKYFVKNSASNNIFVKKVMLKVFKKLLSSLGKTVFLCV